MKNFSASFLSTCCKDYRSRSTNLINRYRDFLLSKETIVALINGILLLAGFVVSLSGAPGIGRWLYFASAVIGGTPLYLLAAKSVFIHHDVTAGFMAAVAMIAAIVVGEYSAAALVVFMFAIGDWLENLTVARADYAIRELAKLVPATVVVMRDGQEMRVPIEEVRLVDQVLVRSGERIGVDGRVLRGSASVNQSAITGESMPIEKKPADEVYAGTLNEVGALEIQVTRLGQDSTLGQIVKLVEEARKIQAPVQRIANRYASILVPITFAIAVVVYLLSGDILRSITVLVVVCPCALVLATPTALVAAIANAAKRGLLVKSGAVIEQIGKIDVVAFDKTGTLTYGRPVVQDIVSVDGISEEQILSWAASTEHHSEHAIGRAIVQVSNDRRIEVVDAQEFSVLPGYGVSARVENRRVVIGTRVLLLDHGVLWTKDVDREIEYRESQGQTVALIAVDNRLVGLITLSDTPRIQAKKVIAELKNIGIKEVLMISGDNPRTAERIAKELGIERVYAEVLPQDKLEIIRALQSNNKKVAFVGDGVNDAPALAAADIGIAMGLAGTDVALDSADIGLMADEIERIPQIIDLSRQSLRIIRQNVIFSMAMNVLSVVLGGFGIIGPAIGALMHETSALPVLANAARLVNYRKPVVN